MAKPLITPKQLAFACAFIETGNASESYRRSYDASQMSQRAIEVEACRLLARPNVAAKVEELRGKAAEVASVLSSLGIKEPNTEPPEPIDIGDKLAGSDEPDDESAQDPKDPEVINPEAFDEPFNDPVDDPEASIDDPEAENPEAEDDPEPPTLSREDQVVLNRAWVLVRLMKNARVSLGEEPIRLKYKPKDKDEVIEIEVTQRDATAANRALELLGKEMGLFNGAPPPDTMKLNDERSQRDLARRLIYLLDGLMKKAKEAKERRQAEPKLIEARAVEPSNVMEPLNDDD